MQLRRGAILELEIANFKIQHPYFILPETRALPIYGFDFVNHYYVDIDFRSVSFTM